jgi:hypothetical protein
VNSREAVRAPTIEHSLFGVGKSTLSFVPPYILNIQRLISGASVVCTEILNSGVVVMESAKDGARIDDTGPLNRARDRRILVQ